MSVGIGTISKGLFQQGIEKVANNVQHRAAFLQALKDPVNPRAWFHFLEDQEALASSTTDYVRNQWCKFWPTYCAADVVEAILRQSLIEAIELANSRTSDLKNLMPIDCHWIWKQGIETFEVLLTYNERQVTRILLTPPPPTNPRLSLLGLAPYFIVKTRRDHESNVVQEKELPRDPQAPWVTIQIKAQR